MQNKVFWILLVGCIIAAISAITSAMGLLPDFLKPFVVVVYGLYIVYMAR